MRVWTFLIEILTSDHQFCTALSHWPARIPDMKWTNGLRRYIQPCYGCWFFGNILIFLSFAYWCCDSMLKQRNIYWFLPSLHTVSAQLSLYRPFELVDTISNMNGWSKRYKDKIIWLDQHMVNRSSVKCDWYEAEFFSGNLGFTVIETKESLESCD